MGFLQIFKVVRLRCLIAAQHRIMPHSRYMLCRADRHVAVIALINYSNKKPRVLSMDEICLMSYIIDMHHI